MSDRDDVNPLTLSDQGKRTVDSDEERPRGSFYGRVRDDDDDDDDLLAGGRSSIVEEEEEEDDSPVGTIKRLIKPMYWSWLATPEAITKIPNLQINILNRISSDQFDFMRDLLPLFTLVRELSAVHDKMAHAELETMIEMMPELPAIIGDCIKIMKVVSVIEPLVLVSPHNPFASGSHMTRRKPLSYDRPDDHFSRGTNDDDDDDDDNDDDDDDDDGGGFDDVDLDADYDAADASKILKGGLSIADISPSSSLTVLKDISDELVQALKRTKCVSLDDLFRYPENTSTFLDSNISAELDLLRSKIKPFLRFIYSRSRRAPAKHLHSRKAKQSLRSTFDDDNDYNLDRRNLSAMDVGKGRFGTLGSMMGSKEVSGFYYCSKAQLGDLQKNGIYSPFLEFQEYQQLLQDYLKTKGSDQEDLQIKEKLDRHPWRLRVLTHQDDAQALTQRPPTDLDVFQFLSTRLYVFTTSSQSPLERYIAKFASTGSVCLLSEPLPDFLWQESFALDKELFSSEPLLSHRFEARVEIDIHQIEIDFLSGDEELVKALVPLSLMGDRVQDVRRESLVPKVFHRTEPNSYFNVNLETMSRMRPMWDNYCPGLANPLSAISHFLVFCPELRIPPRYIKSIAYLNDA